MSPKALLLIAIVLLSLPVLAQNNTEDVVYLKNGSVIRGKMVPPATIDSTRQSVSIELLGGSIFVFQQSEIDSIKKENAAKATINRFKKDYFRRNKGYRNMTEGGIIYGTNINNNNAYGNNGDDFGFSLHTVNGYQWWPYLFAGAGLGIDRYSTYRQTFSPFYLRLVSEFLKKKVTPYVFVDIGYAVMWKQKSNDYATYKNKGGFYTEAGAGVRFFTRSKASVTLSAAYKHTRSNTITSYSYYESPVYNVKRIYQRLALAAGVSF